MPSVPIHDDHTLIRYVSWTKIRKDQDDNPVGILGIAYTLRDGEDYLSASWCEYFGSADWTTNFNQSVNAIRNSGVNVGKKSAFSYALVRKIDAFMKERNVRVRFLHEAEDDNPCHAALRRWPRDNSDLLNLLAEETWNCYVMNANVP